MDTEAQSNELAIRILEELPANKGRLIGKTFFEGGDMLYCVAGAFRFHIGPKGENTIDLHAGEMMFIYPGNIVAIDSLKANGNLRYLILNGSKVAEYFGSFGIYDLFVGKGESQADIFHLAAKRFADGDHHSALVLIGNAITNFCMEQRRGGRGQFFDAIRSIMHNLDRGIARLKPVYTELSISRATLHRIFNDAGMIGPGEFIRHEQFRRARHLLTTTSLPISEIAANIGISSSIYFTEFIRKFTGVTPSELRRRGAI